MEELLAVVILVFLIFSIIIMGLLLLMILKLKRIFTRALTFVFTISLKPRYRRYKP